MMRVLAAIIGKPKNIQHMEKVVSVEIYKSPVSGP